MSVVQSDYSNYHKPTPRKPKDFELNYRGKVVMISDMFDEIHRRLDTIVEGDRIFVEITPVND